MEKSSAFNNLLVMVLEDGQRECRCLVCNRGFANDEELGEAASRLLMSHMVYMSKV
jgi:hypothetical protein